MNKSIRAELNAAIEEILFAKQRLGSIASKLYPISANVVFTPVGINGISDCNEILLFGKISRMTVVYEGYDCEVDLEIMLNKQSQEWVIRNVDGNRFKIDYRHYPVHVNALDKRLDLQIIEDDE